MISVIICTRDRASKLERCLAHLRENCSAPGFEWQLVVVDNASEDATSAVISRFAGSLPLDSVIETRRGLSHARNRGIAAARYPIIAFTDDDCLVGAGWLGAILGEFATRPELSVLGGRVELADASDCPVSTRLHDRPERIATIAQILSLMSGCNMAFRREVFEAVGPFDPAFGKGKSIGSAEDIDLFYRALMAGIEIAYRPDVVVHHAHGRDNPRALESVTHDYIRGRGAFYCKFIGDRSIAKMAYWEVRSLLAEWWSAPAKSGSPRLLCSLAAGAFYQLAHTVRNGAARGAHRLTG